MQPVNQVVPVAISPQTQERRTFIGPYGDRREISGPQFTDKQVADRVRMLFRDQLDHEMVCTLARDRIMHLSEKVQVQAAEIKRLQGIIEVSNAS